MQEGERVYRGEAVCLLLLAPLSTSPPLQRPVARGAPQEAGSGTRTGQLMGAPPAGQLSGNEGKAVGPGRGSLWEASAEPMGALELGRPCRASQEGQGSQAFLFWAGWSSEAALPWVRPRLFQLMPVLSLLLRADS